MGTLPTVIEILIAQSDGDTNQSDGDIAQHEGDTTHCGDTAHSDGVID